MHVSQILDETLKDAVFYEYSGGGMTLSGGEPLAQPEFALALLRGAREAGLHTCVETCGFGPMEAFCAATPYVDLFLWDVKDTCRERHRRNTGVYPDSILDNLHAVDALGGRTQLRCIMIEGVNEGQEHLDAIQALAGTLEYCVGIEFLPYHPLGTSKYTDLGFPSPITKRTKRWNKKPVC